MTKQEAQELMQQIKKDDLCVKTEIRHIRKGEKGYNVVATLTHKHLRMPINFKNEWPPIRDMWKIL